MLRLSPSLKGERITQAHHFRVEPGGSESNIACALSNLGLPARFITKLPDNILSDKIIQFLQQFNIDTSHILKEGDKLGIYWVENGSGPRNSFVIYDRDKSAFSEMRVDDFYWINIFSDSSWFHFSGISPAISENISNILLEVISKISIPFSVDLNYRTKLWSWTDNKPELINKTMSKLCENATLIAGNESDFQNVLMIHPKSKGGDQKFHEIATQTFSRFSKIKYIAISNRESLSASSNIWNGYLFVRNDQKFKYIGVKYNIENIEDRVGTGDSFMAGIIYGLLQKKTISFQKIVDFATTLSALNHTTLGDVSRYKPEEVWGVMKSKGSGRIIR